MFLSLFQVDPAVAVAVVMGFVVGIVLHEASHAYSAYLLGDDTAYRAGRVTLNPAAHLDVLGSLMLLMAGFGWGKPTPVVPSKLRGGVLGPVAVAFAGPASNLLIVAVCAILFRIPAFQSSYLFIVVIVVAFANALLFVFNLIPIPPLAGRLRGLYEPVRTDDLARPGAPHLPARRLAVQLHPGPDTPPPRPFRA